MKKVLVVGARDTVGSRTTREKAIEDGPDVDPNARKAKERGNNFFLKVPDEARGVKVQKFPFQRQQ